MATGCGLGGATSWTACCACTGWTCCPPPSSQVSSSPGAAAAAPTVQEPAPRQSSRLRMPPQHLPSPLPTPDNASPCPCPCGSSFLLSSLCLSFCLAGDGEDPEEARLRMPRPATVGKPRGSSGSLFSRAITSLISIEGSDGATAEQVRWCLAGGGTVALPSAGSEGGGCGRRGGQQARAAGAGLAVQPSGTLCNPP